MRFLNLLVASLFSLPLPLCAQTAVGELFQVNASTEGGQQWPAPAMAPGGAFVVVWEDVILEPEISWEVAGQLFASDGTAVGPQFQANTYTPDVQRFAAVAMQLDGSFVVVWDEGFNQDGNYGGVFGQRFDAAGDPVGRDFHVNLNAATNTRPAPDVATWDDGSFVVVWSGVGLGDGHGILGLRYDSQGLPMGEEFQVNGHTTDRQLSPSVATLSNNGFVVTWTSANQDGSPESIFGQRFDSDDTQVGPEFSVNSYVTGRQRVADVAATPAGDFVVIWNSYDGQDGDGTGVFGQRFGSSGEPLGSEFALNTRTAGNQLRPKIANVSRNRFIVVWQDVSNPVGRFLDHNGLPSGEEFLVTSYITGHQQNARVAAAGSDFVVVWGSYGQDGDRGGIFGQRFVDDAIFADGFESGDTSAWN